MCIKTLAAKVGTCLFIGLKELHTFARGASIRSGFRHFSDVSDSSGANSKNIATILEFWKENFRKLKIPEPKESAEYIIANALNFKKIPDLYKNEQQSISRSLILDINRKCRDRVQRMPVQYIIGEWDFRDLTLKMSRPVFIPRPETEILVEIVLEEIDRKKSREILELCCGSGAISLALLKSRPMLHAVAVDISKEACCLTMENATLHNLSGRIKIIEADVNNFRCAETFDIIVCNPPYVTEKGMQDLPAEVAFYEDPRALEGGGEDGLSTIESILRVSNELLNYGGKLFLELDPSQPRLIRNFLRKNCADFPGLRMAKTARDFANKERFAEVIKEK